MREIKFRAWDLDFKKMWLPHDSCFEYLKNGNQQVTINNFMNCERVNVSIDNNINMNEVINDFIDKLGGFERYLEKPKKEREQ